MARIMQTTPGDAVLKGMALSLEQEPWFTLTTALDRMEELDQLPEGGWFAVALRWMIRFRRYPRCRVGRPTSSMGPASVEYYWKWEKINNEYNTPAYTRWSGMVYGHNHHALPAFPGLSPPKEDYRDRWTAYMNAARYISRAVPIQWEKILTTDEPMKWAEILG